MDEIHVNPTISYKGGAFAGAAQNAINSQAHSGQAFMIASMFGKTKEVVSLNPVKNLIAEDLHKQLEIVIRVVQTSGFIIVALISDNNQVNCKAFESLCDTGDWNTVLPTRNTLTDVYSSYLTRCTS